MPYAVRKKDEKYQVVNKDTGRVFGTHTTKKKARAQQSALYVHASPSKESFTRKLNAILESI